MWCVPHVVCPHLSQFPWQPPSSLHRTCGSLLLFISVYLCCIRDWWLSPLGSVDRGLDQIKDILSLTLRTNRNNCIAKAMANLDRLVFCKVKDESAVIEISAFQRSQQQFPPHYSQCPLSPLMISRALFHFPWPVHLISPPFSLPGTLPTIYVSWGPQLNSFINFLYFITYNFWLFPHLFSAYYLGKVIYISIYVCVYLWL